ncbi:MAG: glycosyltransferase family 2 protein [Lactobacillus sp.]|nr:glycosyltransferase family 2 protein [Lactobacillus sp.]
MNKIEISIIIPCYNVEKYIQSVIRQLQEQSYQNFEVIFIDDGSTDSTNKQITSRINKLDNYHLYTIKNNGAANARNLGLKQAIGEYIYFFDADDKLNPFLLEKIAQQMKKDEADLLIFGYYAKNLKGQVIYKGRYKDKVLLNNNEAIFSFFRRHFFENNLFSPWNKLYRSQFLKENAIYFPLVSSSEDALFNLELFKYLGRVSISNELLYEYTVGRSGSLQTTKSSTKFMEEYEVCSKLKQLVSPQFLDENIYYSYLINTMYKYLNIKQISDVKENSELREVLEKRLPVNLSIKTKVKLFILRMKWKCYK